MRARCLFVLLIVSSTLLMAQTPCFTTNDTLGCLPLTVTMNDCSGAPESNIVYIFEQRGEFDSTTSKTFTFTEAGTHSVSQLIGTNNGIKELTKDNYIRVVDPVPPSFNLYACEGLIFHIEITDNNYQKYIVSYPDSTPNDTITAGTSIDHAFTTSGIKTITVEGFFEGFICSNSTSKSLATIDFLQKPEVTILESNDTSNKITFTTNQQLEYYIQQKPIGGAFSIKDTISFVSDSATLLILKNNTTDHIYQITCFDRCGNTLVGDELQTIQLTATSQNNFNELNWSTYEATNQFNEYKLLKNDTSINLNTTNHPDSNVVCGNDYCYQIRIETTITNSVTNKNTLIYSNKTCIEAHSDDTPSPAQNLHSTIINDSLQLHWNAIQKPSAAKHFIHHGNSTNDFSLSEPFLSSDTFYRIKDTSNCFKISYEDICGNTSPLSNYTCPIKITTRKIDNSTDERFISKWTNYNQNPNLSYSLIISNSNNDIIYTEDNLSSNTTEFIWPNQTDQKIYIYVTTSESNFVSSSYTSFLEEAPIIIYPNAFSPNDDGLNDLFKPLGRFIASYNLKIYNSMGVIIFSSTQQTQAWDGTYNNTPVPPGTYYYESTVTDYKGNTKASSGAISVIY